MAHERGIYHQSPHFSLKKIFNSLRLSVIWGLTKSCFFNTGIMTIKRLHFILIFLIGIVTLTAQTQGDKLLSMPKDTSVVKDSLKTAADTLHKKGSDVDSVVYASGKDSLIFFVQDRKMDIYGSGDLKYKNTNLKSGKIFVDFTTNNVQAYGKESDSLKGQLTETPVLVDKGEEYKGTRMRYNFKTTRGYITYAATKGDEAAYSGAKINKMDRSTFFIEHGLYTTCDAADPHYCFYGTEMKVIQKEQMMGKWVWLTFAGVPFPIPLPFVVVPLQSGRRSGIIPPAYGESGEYGKYFSHMGYFWAINDYIDEAMTGDYFTQGSYRLNSRFRYAKRYNFSGLIQGGYADLVTGEKTDAGRTERKEWNIQVVHNQTLTPTSRFDVNLNFLSSSEYNKLSSSDISQLLNNVITSNATYYKNWEESGSSMSVNYNRTQNLSSGNITEILPSISFSKSQFYPFKSSTSSTSNKWYELLGINYSGQLQNRRVKESGDLQIRGGIQHSLSTGFSPKFGYFNVAPNFSYREDWYTKQIERTSVLNAAGTGDSLITRDVHKLGFVRTYSMGVSASTKLYGIVQPQFAGIAAIRHIISPSISYNFTPDFSKDKWGYYSKYKSAYSGEEVLYSKYEKEIFGGAPRGEQQSIGLSIDNLFEMKTTTDPHDTTSKENKIQLLNLSGNTSYNFAADSMRFNDIYLSYRSQVGSLLSFSGSSSYTIYSYDEKGNKISRMLSSDNRGFLRLLNFGFSASLNFSGDKITSGNNSGEKPANEGMPGLSSAYQQANKTYRGLYESEEADFSIPWSIALYYNYSFSKYNPYSTSKSSDISGTINFNLSPTWKFIVSGHYNIWEKRFAAPSIQVSKDLHCWLMNFTWNPLGTFTGYRFEIRVKAPQLQDLKVTKADNFYSGR